jgi:hypothetical protein
LARGAVTTCIVVASGPSFTESQAELIRAAHAAGKCHLLVVNRMWERFPDADVLYAADPKWWALYWPQVEAGFNGECWTCIAETARRYGLCYIPYEDGPGLSRKPGVIRSGANSGYQAIGLAYELGATRIILAGFDMQFGPAGEKHSHPDYPATWSNASGIAAWVKNFGPLECDLHAAGVTLINCSLATALTIPRGDLATELAAL